MINLIRETLTEEKLIKFHNELKIDSDSQELEIDPLTESDRYTQVLIKWLRADTEFETETPDQLLRILFSIEM